MHVHAMELPLINLKYCMIDQIMNMHAWHCLHNMHRHKSIYYVVAIIIIIIII